MTEFKLTASFAPSGFFALRTPLLPFKTFLEWSDGLEAPQALALTGDLAQALARDRALLRARLHAAVMQPEIRDALFVASPDLDDATALWIRAPESEKGQRAERALVRYFTRMTTRPTPFGLFAGHSPGRIDTETRLTISGLESYQRHTRPDMDYLSALTDALRRDPALRSRLIYRPNSSLYTAAGRLRYVEGRMDGKIRTYHLVSVEATDYLEATLERARSGASIVALAEPLVDEEVSLEEAEEYIVELIESQLLVPELAPWVTGAEPIHLLIEQLRCYLETAHIAAALNHVREALAAIDGDGVGVETARYRAIAEALEDLPAPVEMARLFQVDLVKPAPNATLGRLPLDEIVRGVELLQRLTGTPGGDSLARFQEAFESRYEGREVPLLEALDEEIGIGFPVVSASEDRAGAPLLRGLAFPAKTEETTRWSARERVLLRKLAEALAQNAPEIVLTPEDLEAMASKDPPPLPDAFAVMAVLSAASEEQIAQGDFRVVIEFIMGPSGARLLGRFCHADADLCAQVAQHLRAEEASRPDAIFAEVVHLPEGRIGNVISRPVLREYEIPYLGASGAPTDHQIPVTDLMLSVRNGRLVLRSARLQREIVPRLSTAHNFTTNSLGVYGLLCTLQEQHVIGGMRWSWGALESAPFLPRVVTGRVMLSRARWLVRKEEIQALTARSGAEQYRIVQEWRASRNLPRMAALVDFDNTLPVDFDNILSIEAFLSIVKLRDEAILTEILPAPDQLCVRGPEGRFAHELVVPFVRKSGPTAVDSPPDRQQKRRPVGVFTAPVPRAFPPGSEWLYAKLYTGPSVADEILRDIINPFLQRQLASGAVDRWFFIRYADPDFHLRLRLHGDPERLGGQALPALQAVAAPLLADGRIRRFQIDTYEREVERYGGPEGVVLAEHLFHSDSLAALEIVERLERSDEGLDERWRLALRGTDMLLADLGCDLQARYTVIQQAREGFAREFSLDAGLQRQLGAKFREQRRSLEMLLDPFRDAESPLQEGIACLIRRSERLVPIVVELRARERAGGLTASLEEMALSFIHMQMNRLLRSAHRAQELVIYDFLARLYESQIARQKRDQEQG